MKKIDSRAVPYLRLTALLGTVLWLLGAGLVIGLTLYFSWPVYIIWISVAILIIIFIVDVFISPKVFYRVTRYGLFDNHIIVRRGFIFISTTLVPIKRIQGVTLRTGPVSRRYNLAKVQVLTASTRIELPPLNIQEGLAMKQGIMDLVKEELTDV